MKGHQREASYATQEHGHKEILFKVEQHAAQTVKSNFPYHIVNILAFQKKNIVNILCKIYCQNFQPNKKIHYYHISG
jgi:hypothetical protein